MAVPAFLRGDHEAEHDLHVRFIEPFAGWISEALDTQNAWAESAVLLRQQKHRLRFSGYENKAHDHGRPRTLLAVNTEKNRAKFPNDFGKI
jgi:hypothetical protein